MSNWKKRIIKSYGVFSMEKILENRFLNLVGVQVLRLILAKWLASFRRFRKGFNAKLPEQKEFRDIGFVRKENFLKSDLYKKLKDEVKNVLEDESIQPMIRQYGPVTKSTYDVSKIPQDKREAMTEFFSNEFISQMFSYCERDEYRPFHKRGVRYIEVVVQNELIPGKYDYETDLHSDTFFDTHKAWLYMTDVTIEDAPLVVVPKTHRLNWTRIKKEYFNSIARRPQISRRISESELKGSGQKEVPMACNENTLVVANTFAYHRRHDGIPGRNRIALHISERSNPFRI